MELSLRVQVRGRVQSERQPLGMHIPETALGPSTPDGRRQSRGAKRGHPGLWRHLGRLDLECKLQEHPNHRVLLTFSFSCRLKGDKR